MCSVFIQCMIFWGLGYGCTGKQENGGYHSGTGSTNSEDGSERPDCEPCGALSVRSQFRHMLPPTYLYHCYYCYLCCEDCADIISLCAAYSLCKVLLEVALVLLMANAVLMLFTADWVSFVFFQLWKPLAV